MDNKIKISIVLPLMLTGCIQLDPYQKYHSSSIYEHCVPSTYTSYSEHEKVPAFSEHTDELEINESGFEADTDEVLFTYTDDMPEHDVNLISVSPEMIDDKPLSISEDFNEQQIDYIEPSSPMESVAIFSTGETSISNSLGSEEALYVQVFATLDEENARNVLSDVKLFFPEQTSVIRSAGVYRILIGPLEEDETKHVVNEVNKKSDYSTAFVLTHFMNISDDET